MKNSPSTTGLNQNLTKHSIRLYKLLSHKSNGGVVMVYRIDYEQYAVLTKQLGLFYRKDVIAYINANFGLYREITDLIID